MYVYPDFKYVRLFYLVEKAIYRTEQVRKWEQEALNLQDNIKETTKIRTTNNKEAQRTTNT